MTFWHKLPKPFLVLAPMADVTDAAFRRIIAKYGKPDVMFTEFVSADGLVHSRGREKLLPDLRYDESERPIIAQLFTANPEKMEQAARLVAELGFDGLDINMGCPDRSVEKQGAGAALIKNPKLAREIIRAAKRGIASASRLHLDIPVSVKTRLGYHRDELEKWLPELLAERPAAITLHARTRKEMSKVPARWERIAAAVKLRDQLQADLSAGERTLIIGNGDVDDLDQARERAARSGADGVMLGRAIFGNPWLFARSDLKDAPRSDLKKRLRVLVEHAKLFEQLFTGVKSFAIMKKHFKAYLPGSKEKELREKLMAAETAQEVESIVGDYLVSI